jgi:hypothetical protein
MLDDAAGSGYTDNRSLNPVGQDEPIGNFYALQAPENTNVECITCGNESQQ